MLCREPRGCSSTTLPDSGRSTPIGNARSRSRWTSCFEKTRSFANSFAPHCSTDATGIVANGDLSQRALLVYLLVGALLGIVANYTLYARL